MPSADPELGGYQPTVKSQAKRAAKAEEELRAKDQLVKEQKENIRSLKDSLKVSRANEAEMKMLREAHDEHQKIARAKILEIERLTEALREKEQYANQCDTELARLREAEASNLQTIKKYMEEEKSRQIAEAEAARLKRKREEAEEEDMKKREKTLKARKVAGALSVEYTLNDSGAAGALLIDGLNRLYEHGELTDTILLASGDRRIAIHRSVLGAITTSVDIRKRLQENMSDQVEINLSTASREAVELVVRWLYGKLTVAHYEPSSDVVNDEVLALSSELGLPPLTEICCACSAAHVTVSSFVNRVRLCEKYGLSAYRAALLESILKDSAGLQTVAKDASTLEHPALMRELLAAVAMKHIAAQTGGA